MTTTDTELDPMGQSCDDIDISFPLMPAANYPFEIVSAEVARNKADDGDNIEVKWKNVNPATSTKGAEIVAGQIQLTTYVGLTEKPARVGDNNRPIKARTTSDIAKDITRLVKAVGLKGVSPAQVKATPSMLVGKQAVCKVAVQAETSQFPESNKISGFVIAE